MTVAPCITTTAYASLAFMIANLSLTDELLADRGAADSAETYDGHGHSFMIQSYIRPEASRSHGAARMVMSYFSLSRSANLIQNLFRPFGQLNGRQNFPV